jgi:hypothetical protein
MRKRRQFLISIISLTLLLQTACTPLYFPNSRNMPLLHDKGELKLNTALSNNGLELQSALAINDYFGIMLNGTYFNDKAFNEDEYFLKNSNSELAYGFFAS